MRLSHNMIFNGIGQSMSSAIFLCPTRAQEPKCHKEETFHLTMSSGIFLRPTHAQEPVGFSFAFLCV